MPVNALFFKCDLVNYRSLKRITGKVFQHIDADIAKSITLINNAAVIGPIGSIDSLTAEAIVKAYKVNLLSQAIMISEFIKQTQKVSVKKTIINISSGAAVRAYGGISLYSSSKAALDQLTHCVRKEQTRQKYPVKIVALHVCSMDTNMQDKIRAVSEAEFPSIGRFITIKKEGKLTKPNRIADQVIKFLNNTHLKHEGIYHINKEAISSLEHKIA